jgi:hypothetical protein
MSLPAVHRRTWFSSSASSACARHIGVVFTTLCRQHAPFTHDGDNVLNQHVFEQTSAVALTSSIRAVDDALKVGSLGSDEHGQTVAISLDERLVEKVFHAFAFDQLNKSIKSASRSQGSARLFCPYSGYRPRNCKALGVHDGPEQRDRIDKPVLRFGFERGDRPDLGATTARRPGGPFCPPERCWPANQSHPIFSPERCLTGGRDITPLLCVDATRVQQPGR